MAMTQDSGLGGKVAIVTGGSRGIGRAIVELLAAEGADVTLFYRDQIAAAQEVVAAAQSASLSVGSEQVDVRDSKACAAAVDRIAKEDEVFFSERFVLPRPLLKAIMSEKPVVLLIDEIDKADAEFEAFLLELLSDFQVTVPEIGTFKARQIPLVVLTSNNAREMSDALKRRCLHLYIDFPERDQELEIIKLKAPEAADKLAAEVVSVVQSLRKLDLKKSPGISETIDWVKALTLLNVQNLDQELVNETLDTIVKYEGDVRKAQEELKEYVRRARARRGSDAGPAGGPASDKDLLN